MNPRHSKWSTAVAIIYGLIGLVVFGHAAADAQRRMDYGYRLCLESATGFPCSFGPTELPVVRGLAAGAAWPLYLSWLAFESSAS